MHLKSYEIDGQLLRTGAANFSASGLKRQDNDLIVLNDAQAAEKFKHVFEARFASGEILSLGRPISLACTRIPLPTLPPQALS